MDSFKLLFILLGSGIILVLLAVYSSLVSGKKADDTIDEILRNRRNGDKADKGDAAGSWEDDIIFPEDRMEEYVIYREEKPAEDRLTEEKLSENKLTEE